MTRYTHKALEKDAEDMNLQLATIGAPYRLVVGSRYNYSAVDLATPEQAAAHCCQTNLECGTPRECLAACNRHVASEALNAVARLQKGVQA